MEEVGIRRIQAEIGPREICMPKGYFILIRKGNSYGAIKFTEITPGENIGEGSAVYESFYQGDGTGSFLTIGVERNGGDLIVKPMGGIGRLSYKRGKFKLSVGIWAFEYHSPGCVHLYPYGNQEGDYGFEFAPTVFQDVEKIDVFDKRLKWFRFDLDRSFSLPMDDLQKGK